MQTLTWLLIVIIIIIHLVLFSGNQQSNAEYSNNQVIKTKNSEQFVLPYSATNNDRLHPLVYTYAIPKTTNWILTIQNNLSYTFNKEAKTIVKLQEPRPSDKFIEIAMFSDISKKFWAAVNTHDSGYVRLYEKDTDGWSRDQPIIIAHENNQGLSITNGKRIIVDKLSINDFTIGSIAVYGKDDPQSVLNTYAGDISFDVIYGNPADSPIFFLPLGMLVGVGGLVIGLLFFKKRKISY